MRARPETAARGDRSISTAATGAVIEVMINARWMSKPVTGTERYAAEVTHELLMRKDVRATLIVPEDALIPSWAADARVIRSRFSGMLFEQLALPLISFGRHLISLSGPAPLLKRNQSVVLFDASTFRFPKTFSRAFVAWYAVLYWTLARTARHVFTISQFSADEIAEVVRVPRSRLTIALCGADHAAGVPSSKPDFDVPEQFALCVGTLAERKNLGPILRTFAREGVPTVVVGAAGSSRVFSRTSGLGESDSAVTFASRLSDSEVYWLMEHATALVFPSFYEGFGLPVVEAQTRGCPVICAESSSLPEVTGNSALLFDPSDPEQALSRFREVEANEERRRELVERGRRNAARFTWGAAAQTIAETLGAKARRL